MTVWPYECLSHQGHTPPRTYQGGAVMGRLDRRTCVAVLPVVWLLAVWTVWQETTFWDDPLKASLERILVGTAETRADCERLADQHATRLADRPKQPREWRARAGNGVAGDEGAAHKASWAYRGVPGAESQREWPPALATRPDPGSVVPPAGQPDR